LGEPTDANTTSRPINYIEGEVCWSFFLLKVTHVNQALRAYG
jgi:hypothetical protein